VGGIEAMAATCSRPETAKLGHAAWTSCAVVMLVQLLESLWLLVDRHADRPRLGWYLVLVSIEGLQPAAP